MEFFGGRVRFVHSMEGIFCQRLLLAVPGAEALMRKLLKLNHSSGNNTVTTQKKA
jgi:hypothetical protein